MAMADSQPKLIGLVWVLAATRRSVYIRQMNRANSHSGFGHDDSAISIVVVINVITIITDMIGVVQMDGVAIVIIIHVSMPDLIPLTSESA